MNATNNQFGRMPFAGHRTMGQVMRGEVSTAPKPAPVTAWAADHGDGHNPFNCPPSVHTAMRDLMTPLLSAVLMLGPGRVQWLGTPKINNGLSEANTPTCWALDGKRATQGEIVAAARVAGRAAE